MGSIASSLARFRYCAKNFPRVPDVFNYYGEVLRDQGDIAHAIEKFDFAIDLENQTKPMAMNVLPLINKAWATYEQKRDAQEVKTLCEKALISKFVFYFSFFSTSFTYDLRDWKRKPRVKL